MSGAAGYCITRGCPIPTCRKTHAQTELALSLIRTVSAAREGVVYFAETVLCGQLQSPLCRFPHSFLSSLSSPINRTLIVTCSMAFISNTKAADSGDEPEGHARAPEPL
jgi:hypothetical protein